MKHDDLDIELDVATATQLLAEYAIEIEGKEEDDDVIQMPMFVLRGIVSMFAQRRTKRAAELAVAAYVLCAEAAGLTKKEGKKYDN